MAFYFSMAHLGARTSEVESLPSYYFRLAEAHGCSTWQLSAHMIRWWHQSNPDLYCFPRDALGIKSISACGQGKSVRILAEALETGTGCDTLRSGTLLAFSNVTSPSNIGMLKASRAWCPVCYQDDKRSGQPAYDRLLWAIRPIGRCAIHRLRLQLRCPACDALQYYFSRKRGSRDPDLATCGRCSGSLAESSHPAAIANRPDFGEKLLHELVGAVSTEPTLELDPQAMRSIFGLIRREVPKGHPLLASDSLFSASKRPSFMALLKHCEISDLSLLDFLPFAKSTRPLLELGDISDRQTGRKWHPLAIRRKILEELTRLLESDEELPSHAKFCQRMNVPLGYPVYWFPEIHKRYMDRRKQETQRRAESLRSAALAAIDTGMLNSYLSGNVTRQRQAVRTVSRMTGASVGIVRRALRERLGRRMT